MTQEDSVGPPSGLNLVGTPEPKHHLDVNVGQSSEPRQSVTQLEDRYSRQCAEPLCEADVVKVGTPLHLVQKARHWAHLLEESRDLDSLWEVVREGALGGQQVDELVVAVCSLSDDPR